MVKIDKISYVFEKKTFICGSTIVNKILKKKKKKKNWMVLFDQWRNFIYNK